MPGDTSVPAGAPTHQPLSELPASGLGGIAGRAVLITGAAGGIGSATAQRFARHGARLLLADCDGDGLTALAGQLRGTGVEVATVAVDITRDEPVREMVALAMRHFGALDIAFNNAGISGGGQNVADVAEEQWERTLAVNLTGTWRCMKHEIAAMRSHGGGVIVNNCSVFGLTGGPGAAYTASKHGVAGLTRSAALSCAADGIRVNAVCPGIVDAGIGQRAILDAPERLERIMACHPLGRFGTAEEVADTVLYLCSDLARYVTGHLLSVDGGYMAR